MLCVMVMLLAEYASGAAKDAVPRALSFNNCRRLTMATNLKITGKVSSILMEISYGRNGKAGHHQDD